MRTLRLIGIGPGDPNLLTLAAVDAIAATDVFLLIDKGASTGELADIRRDMLTRFAGSDHREVTVPDPPRDRDPADYDAEVRRWHGERARRLYAALTGSVPADGSGAILVWGDPALYDSSMRLADDMVATAAAAGERLDVEVIPGVTSVSALTASVRVPVNRIGEPIHITTGRRLAQTPVGADRNQVVMLDAHCTFRETANADDLIWWGAYLGTDHEVVIAGEVGQVGEQIAATRERLRAEYGWIMDIYLLRKP